MLSTFSRCLARRRPSRALFVLALACAFTFTDTAPASAARLQMSNEAADASNPESLLHGGGTLEGDIRGGEQNTAPAPAGTLRTDTRPQEAQTATFSRSPWLRWWSKLTDLLSLLGR